VSTFEKPLRVEPLAKEPEWTLRTLALDTKSKRTEREEAIAILADYYEQHGQPSRAALWRELLSPSARTKRRYVLMEVPDLLTRPPAPIAGSIRHTPQRSQTPDCRRNQMIWLLRTQGLSVRKTAKAIGISPTRVEQIVALENRRLGAHAKAEQLRPTLKATERLVAVGALSGDRPTRYGHRERWFDLDVEEPPQDWPAEHKRRGELP
jgi:hypothetical protein